MQFSLVLQPPTTPGYNNSSNNNTNRTVAIGVAAVAATLLSFFILLISLVLCCSYKKRKHRGVFGLAQEDMVASSNHYEVIELQAAGDVSQINNSGHAQLETDSPSPAIYDIIPEGTSSAFYQISRQSADEIETCNHSQAYNNTVPGRHRLFSESDTEATYNRLSHNLGSCLQEFNEETQNEDNSNSEFTETVHYDILDHKVQLVCHQAEDTCDVVASEGSRSTTVEAASTQRQGNTQCSGIYDTIAESETPEDVKKNCEPVYSVVKRKTKKTNSPVIAQPLDAAEDAHLADENTLDDVRCDDQEKYDK